MNERRRISQITQKMIWVIAIVMAIYHLIVAKYILFAFDQHKVIHIGLAVILGYLGFYAKTKSLVTKTVSIVFLIASLFISSYFVIGYHEIVMRVGYPATADYLLGGLMILMVLDSTRRGWGLVIPIITLITLFYAYFGQYLPWIFFHGGIRIPRLMAYSCSYYRGIYGALAGISSMEIFLYILFGCMLKSAGAVDFFMKVGMIVARYFRSGPAQTAVVSSALFGTISGTISANVATTGAITIPTMIKKGFLKEYAGAVEACASSGGQIMPPVMGVSAFIMAGITGIPYSHIALAAALPALVYYGYLGISIEIRAVKRNMPREEFSILDVKASARKHAYLVIPFIILVYSLSLGNPAATGAFHGMMSLIAVFAVRQVLYYGKDFKRALKAIYQFLADGLSEGAISAASVALVTATLGIIIEMFVVTGFGQKLSQAMVEISEGNLLILLFMTAITCIFFGMGMPTTGAYILVALLGAPAMVSLGVPVLNAHMYVFYYAVMAAVTPPVAIGALVASGIAGSNYLKTALFSMRLALPGFVLPFFFIFRPEILWWGYSPLKIIFGFISVFAGLISTTIVIENFLFRKLRIFESLLLCISVALLFDPRVWTSVLGTAILAVTYLYQKGFHKRLKVR